MAEVIIQEDRQQERCQQDRSQLHCGKSSGYVQSTPWTAYGKAVEIMCSVAHLVKCVLHIDLSYNTCLE